MSWLEAKSNARSMTSEEVLIFFNDYERQQYDGEPISEIGAKKTITRDWTVDALLFDLFDTECNSETWRDVGTGLRQFLGIEATDDELECFLKKPTKVSVGDFCDFLATRIKIENLSPAKIMGQTSWEAGIFRTIRQVLRRAGADVSNLAPSSELKPYLIDHSQELQCELTKLFPGYLPSMNIRRAMPIEWIGNLAGWMGFLGWLAMMFGIVIGAFWYLGILGFLVMMSGWVLIWLTDRFQPQKYQLGEFVTFRDLCFALAAHKRAEDAGHPSILRTSDNATITEVTAEDVPLKPVVVLGSSSLTASLFRSISEALARDGADTSQLAPSTEIEPYLRAHRRRLILHLSKVAPGKSPLIREEFPYHARTIRNICRKIVWGSGTVYCAIAFIIGFLLRPDLLVPFGITAISITVVLASIMFCCDLVKPSSVRFGDCVTFKDLCRSIIPKD